jgi:hypothetical protein
MMAATTSNGVKPPRVKRNSVPLAMENSKEAKRLAAAILEVLAGVRTPQQAAEALGLSLPRYYQIEARGLRGLLKECETKPKGRQPNPAKELSDLQRENQRLQRELARQQSLARMAQRSIGLPPPAPPPIKAKGKKSRKRKPAARALTLAARLQQETSAAAPAEGAPLAAVAT